MFPLAAHKCTLNLPMCVWPPQPLMSWRIVPATGRNIATIHGLERSDDVTALVMELVEGPPEKSETIFAVWSDRSGRRGGLR